MAHYEQSNARSHKAYLALFICMSVKAVHLKVILDLSTDSFFAAFNRFITCREIPTKIYSDCGTNYVEAVRELKALFDEASTKNVVQARTQYHWNLIHLQHLTLVDYEKQL